MEHKRGDSFDYYIDIPEDFEDGYFVGWKASAQLRDQATGVLIATFDVSWADPQTTRRLDIRKVNTRSWPVATAEFDVQFVRTSDGFTTSSNTVDLEIIKDVTA